MIAHEPKFGGRQSESRGWWFLSGLVVELSLFLLTIDIGLYDETSYLQSGLDLSEEAPSLESGPLYSAWYWLLSLVIHDHVVLYFTSWCVLVILCLTLPYAIVRDRSAIIYSCLACLLPFYLIWPYINLFSSAIILTAITFLERRRGKSYVVLAAVMLLVCSIVALVRPEFHYAAYFAAMLLVGAVLLERQFRRYAIILGVAVLAFVAVEFAFSTLPGNRSGIAFAAYHDWVMFARGRLQETPRTPWHSYSVFGLTESATVLDFLKANPTEFLAHIFYNLRQPKFVGLLLLGILTIGITSVRVDQGRWRVVIPIYQSIPLVIAYIPTVAATLIVFPKTHYFVIPYLVSVFLISRSQIVAKYCGTRQGLAVLTALAVASIGATFVIQRSKAGERRVVSTIECVASLQAEHHLDQGRVLEALGGLSTYLKGEMTWVRHYEIEPGETVDLFLQRRSPLIIVSDLEMRDYFVQKGNLPGSVSWNDMNSFFQGRGYRPYKCDVRDIAIFFSEAPGKSNERSSSSPI